MPKKQHRDTLGVSEQQQADNDLAGDMAHIAGVLLETCRDLSDALSGRLFYEYEPRGKGNLRLRRRRPGWQPRKGTRRRPLCGAKTRAGTPCRMVVVEGRDRCRLHGGMSTGPKTAEGRERIAESNRRRAAAARAASLN